MKMLRRPRTRLTLDLLGTPRQLAALRVAARAAADGLDRDGGRPWLHLYLAAMPPVPQAAAGDDGHQLPQRTPLRLPAPNGATSSGTAAAAAADEVVPAGPSDDAPVKKARAALRLAWERLHHGAWYQVAEGWRHAYACCSVLLAARLHAAGHAVEALRALDLGLIMGGPAPPWFDAAPMIDALQAEVQQQRRRQQQQQQQQEAADRCKGDGNGCASGAGRPASRHGKDHSARRAAPPSEASSAARAGKRRKRRAGAAAAAVATQDAVPVWHVYLPHLAAAIHTGDLRTTAVPVLHRPSLRTFRRDVFDPRRPHVIRGVVDDWPACGLWNVPYLSRLMGPRTVPVEIGRTYMSEDWTQRLMTVDEFIDGYMQAPQDGVGAGAGGGTGEAKAAGRLPDPIAYLAQHQLFAQIPALGRDTVEPDYCVCADASADGDAAAATSSPVVEKNAWFGPAGTVSPLHFDRYHNLLCQPMGSKWVLLVDPAHTARLAPHPGLQRNTSQVDLQRAGWADRFPAARGLPCLAVHLRRGEMLYIPPRWWHFCCATEASFSVSFWWGAGEAWEAANGAGARG